MRETKKLTKNLMFVYFDVICREKKMDAQRKKRNRETNKQTNKEKKTKNRKNRKNRKKRKKRKLVCIVRI